MKKNNNFLKEVKRTIIGISIVLLIVLVQWTYRELISNETENVYVPVIALDDVPVYSGSPYVTINGGEPFFEEEDMVTESYEYYGDLDSLGRCTVTMACIGKDIMPTESRGDISSVKPTGWVQNNYDFVDGGVLYNRAHLIGFQLTGENANKNNLITGTRYMNTKGMLPFENMVRAHVDETEHHVIYRVTPVFEGENLVAKGVLMEGKCAVAGCEDMAAFCVYVYNVQPGVVIDYATGDNFAE